MATGVTAHGRTTSTLLRQNGETDGKVSPDAESGEGAEEEVVLEGEELFMTLTQEERDAWQKMIEERETNLKTRREKYEQWYDGINRRRMFALSRVRKLKERFQQRPGFYANLSEYISVVESKANSKKNKNTVKFTTQNDTETNGHPATNNTEQQLQQQQQQQQQQENSVDSESTVTVKPLLRQSE